MSRHRWFLFFAIAAGVVLWLYARSSWASAAAGHATPADAMAAGWAVFPMGVTGWEEHGPNGEIIDHDTGGQGVPGEGVATS